MAFRYDMQGKTSQQQMIVAKRDEKEKRRRDAQISGGAKTVSVSKTKSSILLAIDKDTCLKHDNIITKNQCKDCPHYLAFELYNAQPCVSCAYGTKNEEQEIS